MKPAKWSVVVLGLCLWPWSLVLAQPAAQVFIREYRFQPEHVSIRVGEVVRWENAERRTSHSVLFPNEAGLESDRLLPNESWERRFDKPGDYPYRCGPHEEMKGLIHVSE